LSTPGASSGNPFRAILDVGSALVSSLVLEEVFANVAAKIGEAMMVWAVDIQTYDRSRDVLVYEAYWCQEGVTADDRAYIGTITDLGDRPDWRRVIDGRQLVECHVDDPALSARERDELKKWGYKTTLDAPLMVGGEVIGVLGLNEKRFVRRFTPIEKDLFKQLCDLAAVGIHNAQVHRMQQEQTRHLDALVEASRAITSSVVLEDVLATVASQAAKALGSPECLIYEFDAAAEALIWRSDHRVDGSDEMEDKVGAVYPLAENPDDRAILEGGEIVVETISDPALAEDARASMEEWGEKTCLNVPLMFKGEPLGIMVLIESARERRFTEAELELAQALGEQAAAAIRNAQAYQGQEDEARRVSALLEAGTAIASTVDLDEVLATVAREACRALHVDAASVYEYDASTGLYAYRALHEAVPVPVPTPDDDLGTWYPLADYPGDRVMIDGDEIVVHNLSDPELAPDRRESMAAYDEHTTVNVPLRVGQERLGILRFYVYGAERAFGQDELELARGLGEQAAIAIANARLYASVERARQRTDSLLVASRTIASAIDADEVLSRVVREASRVLGVSAAALYECDAAGEAFRYQAEYEEVVSEGPDADLSTWYAFAEHPGERAIFEGDGVVVEYLSDPELPPDRRRNMEEWHEATCLNVPLQVGADRLGILRFYDYEKEREFSDAEIELAKGLCEQAAMAISNARLYEDAQQQKQRVERLLQASRAIASTVDLDEVLARVTREACQALDVSATTVYEYDEVGERFFYRAFHEMVADPRSDDPLGTSYLLSEYPGERFIFESDEVVIENLTDPELSPERREGMELWDERTILSVPMRVGGRRLGVLRFYVYEQPRRFSEAEIDLARGLGEQAAIAIANARLFDRVERARRRTDVLLNASRALTTSLVPKEVFDTITQRASEALGAPRAGLYEYDQVADSLTARSFYGPVPTEGYYELDVPEPISDRPGDRAILAGGEIVVETMSDEGVDPITRAEMEYWNETTALNVPLRFRGETLGILMIIFTHTERTLSDDELALASGLGEQAAIAMYNARLYDDMQRQKQRVDTLLETSELLTSSLVLDEVVTTMTQAAATALGAPRCDIYEYDGTADTLTLKGYYEKVPSGMYGEIGEAQPMAERPGDRIILERGKIVAESVSDPSVDPATRAEMEEWGEKTCLNVPLIVKGEPLGILIITETEDVREFSAAELDLARGLSEQVGMALQNARLYARLETQNRRLLNLLQSSREMTGSMDVEKAVETMCSEMAGLLECPVCHIDVGLRSKSGSFVPAEVVAADEELAANVEPILEPDELTEQALSERQPIQADLGEGSSRLVIPLLAKDEPSGFVEMSGPLGERFGRDKLEVVQILANQAAVAIDNARLYQNRERQAVTDGLTGLYNHRHFYERLTGEVARARRYDVPVALVMLDVDDFKGFNDTYGHQAGDEVLREIGRLLLTSIRQHIDVPARYGGEEFTVILPNTGLTGGRAAGERLTEHFAAGTVRTPEPAEEKAGGIPATPGAPVVDVDAPITEAVPASHPDGAVIVGERLRREVEAAVFRADDGSPLRKVTVSVGVASFPAHAASPDGLVEAADQALYAAKRAGKNRVEIWRKDET